MTDKKCKVCRRAGEKLFLKGDRCFTPKCGFTTHPYPPGRLDSERKHKSTLSEYGEQMKEKQKVRNIYMISEKQFANYVQSATKKTINHTISPALQLYQSLEERLDNIIYRLGLAKSRALSRQIVSHGHITINGRKINVPSYKVRINDVIAVREGSKSTKLFTDLVNKLKQHTMPNWLEFDTAKISAKILSTPSEIKDTFDLAKVLEFYSK